MAPQNAITTQPSSVSQSTIEELSKKVQSLRARADLANGAYIVFLILTVLSTMLLTRWSGKANRAADELIQAKDRKLEADLKEKDVQIADTKERAAKLEKEAADARLELAKIDPVNLPIKSLKADVSLVVRGKLYEAWLTLPPPGNAKKVCSVSIAGEGKGSVRMLCTNFESIPMTMEREGTTIQDARTFSMSFTWPYGDWSEAWMAEMMKQIGAVDLFDEKISTATLDEMLDKKSVVVQILMMPSDGDVEILQSSFVLTINGSIQRKFSLPAKSQLGIINCTPQK
jgi:hypothetical protein